MLSTIRVPKNLLYLTDRLPKPNYSNEDPQRIREQQELMKRKTFEARTSSNGADKIIMATQKNSVGSKISNYSGSKGSQGGSRVIKKPNQRMIIKSRDEHELLSQSNNPDTMDIRRSTDLNTSREYSEQYVSSPDPSA